VFLTLSTLLREYILRDHHKRPKNTEYSIFGTIEYYISIVNSQKLLDNIITVLKPNGQVRRTKKSIWPIYCKSIIDAAYFLTEFDNAKSFYEWAEFFANNEKSKPALPMLISIEISGIGFPLACDFLKEIGFLNYGKPDVHLKDIFKELHLIDPNEKSTIKQDYQTMKLIDRIASDNNTTAFKVDKIFWLIGSGNFYLTDIKIGRNRKEFIEEVKKALHTTKNIRHLADSVKYEGISNKYN